MVAIALPPPTMPVVYENVSRRVVEAEGQKDILFQMLREKWGAQGGLEELDERSTASRVLVVKCVQCGRPEGTYEKGSYENIGNSEVAFRVQSPQGGEERWRVMVSEVAVRFLVVSARDLNSSEIFQSGDAFVRSCRTESLCTGSLSFSGSGEAQQALDSWAGQKVGRAVRAGSPLAVSYFVPDMLVKAHEYVKVTLSPVPEVTLRISGRALTSAPKGSRVRVEVEPFQAQPFGRVRKVIDAVVTAPGEVTYVR